MIRGMHRRLLLVALVLGCESGTGLAAEPLTCSDMRDEITASCEGAAEDLELATRENCRQEHPSDDDYQKWCSEADLPLLIGDYGMDELEDFNACTDSVRDDLLESGSDPDLLAAARDLAYWCDLIQNVYACDESIEKAQENGVEECPATDRF